MNDHKRPIAIPNRSFKATRIRLTVLGIFATLLSCLPASAASPGKITDENIAVKIEAAATAADHQTLSAYFSSKSVEAAKQIKLHEDMLQSYRRRGKADGITITMQSHCQKLMQLSREAQGEYNMLAELHGQLAKESTK